MKNAFRNKVLGAVSIIVENSNHNSDLNGIPRMVNGELAASDVSLKFYVKKALDRTGYPVFNKKTEDVKGGKINDIISRIKDCGIKTKRDFYDFYDCKFFGHTVLHGKKEPESKFNGPMQITYGKNIHSDNSYSVHQITNSFPSNTGEDSNKAATIGTAVKVNKANYLHIIDFSPKNLERDSIMRTNEFKDNIPYFTEDEVGNMKHAISTCVGSTADGSYSSSAKSNTKVGLAVFITFKESNRHSFSITNNIKCTDKYNEYDLSSLIDKVNENRDIIEKVDIRYTKDLVSFSHDLPKSDDFFIISKRG